MLEITDLKYASSNMPVIKVIGVGGCGNNAVNRLSHETPFSNSVYCHKYRPDGS